MKYNIIIPYLWGAICNKKAPENGASLKEFYQ